MFHWPFLLADRWLTRNSGAMSRAGTVAPRWLVQRAAEAKLVHTLRHVWKHNALQRERWRAAGIRGNDLYSPKVLPRIPFFDHEGLLHNPEAFLCVPANQITSMILTSGTTGVHKKIYFTTDDLERQRRMIGARLRRLPGASRVLIIFNLGLEPSTSPAFIAQRGAEAAGMFSLLVPSQSLLPTAVDILCEYRPDVIISSPTRMHQLTLEAGIDLKALGVKYFLLSAEPWCETTRRLIEQAWGAKAIDVYASNETACGIASECVHQNGLHIGETAHWVEIVDTETGEPVADGEEGEIVLTTLSRRGMPLVRYRIGDLARLLPPDGRCACGLNLRKLSRIRGRVDHMLILGGGRNVYPDEVDAAMFGVEGVTDYQLILEKNGYRDVLNLDVECDLTGDVLRDTMTTALGSVKPIAVKIAATRDLDFGTIRRVPRGSLSEGRNKTPRILDRRR